MPFSPFLLSFFSFFSNSSPSMEAPPPLSTAPPIASTVAVSPGSIDSSPRSRHTDSWDADPPLLLPQKLRLMCSYGGHIIPRPHDKSLCYIGGDTRIIVIDRHTSISDLNHRLSKTLLHNQSFSLKYQLPNEDLDALISVTTDEDLEIMVEEYDRLNNAAVGGGSKPGRLRLFLFPKTSSNIEQLLVETASTKSEDWFLNALNGKPTTVSAAVSDRGFSESSSVNCLLGLDDDFVGKAVVGGKDVEAQIDLGSKGVSNGNGNGLVHSVNSHEVHSVPDSPMLETTSSFGSTSSSPTLANLPPIKVHVEDQKVGGLGIEEQFQQMSIGVVGNVNVPPLQKQEEVGGFVAAGTVASGFPAVVGGEYGNKAFSDDERSDSSGYRKAQQIQQQVQPQQIAQFQQKQAGANDFPSPDSISSEGSITNPLSRQRQAIYQEPITQILSGNYRAMAIANPVDLNTGDQNNSRLHMQPQVQESSYVLSSQYDQNHPQLHQPQQFVHAGTQFVPAGAMPIASYYPIYPSQQQHHPHQPEVDQQYPVYFMHTRPAQAYNLQMQQTNYSELAPTASASRPQTTPPATVTSHAAYNQARNAPASKPEMSAGMYRTAAAASQQLVQVPSSQHQAQYVGFTQIHHPSQSIAPSPAANSTYTYEFTDPTHAQIYYTQPLPPQLAAQYQTLASAPAAVLPEPSAQVENFKQQVRSLQP